jgi:Flp pilus assembly protein TadD
MGASVCVPSFGQSPMGLNSFSRSYLLASTALAALLAVGLAGCKTTNGPETTGSLSSTPRPSSDAEWRAQADKWEAAYKAKPDDVNNAMNYAQALRATGQRAQAVAILEQTSIKNPHDKTLLGAYGRALAESGSYEQALAVFSRAHTPEMPDWRLLSAQGAVLDQLGRYDEARGYYASALKIVPEEPSVLSNLGLSYALSKDLKKSEATLRKAVQQPGVKSRTRQNLALVVGLQGRFTEAEDIARADLPLDEAAANVEYLRQMLAQQKKDTAQPRAGQKPKSISSNVSSSVSSTPDPRS